MIISWYNCIYQNHSNIFTQQTSARIRYKGRNEYGPKKLEHKPAKPNSENPYKKISLETIYGECNNHLREMDKNRDQLTEFYLALIGVFSAAFFTIFPHLKKDDNSLIILLFTVGGLLFFIGLIVSRVTIEFRVWHTRYSYTAILLGTLSRDEPSQFDEIEKRIRDYAYGKGQLDINYKNRKEGTPRMPPSWIFSRYLKGTEGFTFLIMPTIAFLPLLIVAIIFLQPLIPSFSLLQEILILILSFCVYFTLFICLSAKYLYRKFYICPWATWIIYGINNKFDQKIEDTVNQGQPLL